MHFPLPFTWMSLLAGMILLGCNSWRKLPYSLFPRTMKLFEVDVLP